MTIVLARRLGLTTAVGVAGLLGSALAAPSAHAMQACFSDPIVYLTNGQQVDLSASIADSATDVSSVTYTLYVPAHVHVLRVVYTGGAFAGKEHLIVYEASSADPSYTSNTTLATVTPGVGLTAHSRVTGSLGTAQASASGQSGQAIALNVTQSGH